MDGVLRELQNQLVEVGRAIITENVLETLEVGQVLRETSCKSGAALQRNEGKEDGEGRKFRIEGLKDKGKAKAREDDLEEEDEEEDEHWGKLGHKGRSVHSNKVSHPSNVVLYFSDSDSE
jgi:hypothetical protein